MSLPLQPRSIERTIASHVVTLVGQHGTEAPHRYGKLVESRLMFASAATKLRTNRLLHLDILQYYEMD